MTQNVQFEYNEQEVYVRNGINAAVAKYHFESDSRGWWVTPGVDMNIEAMANYVYATKLMLTVSEIGEAMEAMRKDRMDDHLPHRKGIEVELADALIRIFDLAGKLKLDLGGAVVEKGRYNMIRVDHQTATRNAAGGKKF